MEKELEQSTKDNLADYKTAYDNLGNRSKLIDIFTLINVKPPTEGSTFFHAIFSWCVEILYESPATSYEWENFKKQAFGKDYGVDFLMRLRGTNIPKYSNYQYQITKALEKYDKF